MLSVVGCGYTTSSSLPSRLHTIYVAPFDNKIDFTSEIRRNVYFPMLEVDVRNATIERFLFDGNLRVSEDDSSDLILRGELVGYERSALRYTDSDDVEEYRIHIIVNLTLWDVEKDEARWVETGFTGEATYFPTGALAKTEAAAVVEAKVDLARRIVERTIEDW